VKEGEVGFSKAHFYKQNDTNRLIEISGYHSKDDHGHFEINDIECEYTILEDDSLSTITEHLHNIHKYIDPKKMPNLINRAYWKHIRRKDGKFVYFDEVLPKTTFEDHALEDEEIPDTIEEGVKKYQETCKERSLDDIKVLNERGFRSVGFGYMDHISSCSLQFATYSRPFWGKSFWDFYNPTISKLDKPFELLEGTFPGYDLETSSSVIYGEWIHLMEKYTLLDEIPFYQRDD